MNHFLKYSFSFFCLLACSACNDDGIDILDIEIPEGYALSAGTSTIFLNSPEVTDYMTMYVQVTTVMAADLVPFMPVIRAAVATGMRDVPNPLYGQRVDRAAMDSLPC